MKILFANNIGGFYGGAEQVVAHAARGLRARGHQCYLAYGVPGRDEAVFAEPFEKTYNCGEFDGPDTDIVGESYGAILADAKPDVVFFHKVTSLPSGAEGTDGPRTIRMVHDTDLFCPTGLGYYRHGRKVCTKAAGGVCYLDLAFLGRATDARFPVKMVSIPRKLKEMRRNHFVDVILANSRFVRDKLVLNGFPSERIHVCHPALPTPERANAPLPETPRILFVGSLLRGKGVDLLLRALQRVSCPFSLTIIGSGKSEGKLKSLCSSLGLDQSVRFEGWVGHQELDRYYDEARVVVVPSRGPETFSLVGIEAMRHGRPVVAFDVGGISDWLEHERTGLLIPEQDLDALARAVEKMLTDMDYACRLGEEAASRVRERFSFETFLDQIEAHLSGVPA